MPSVLIIHRLLSINTALIIFGLLHATSYVWAAQNNSKAIIEEKDQKALLRAIQYTEAQAITYQTLANQTLGKVAYAASAHLLYERYPAYYCYAAALALGREKLAREVFRLYIRRSVDSKIEQVDELLISSLEYSNLADNLRFVATQSQGEIIKNWDLQCSGQNGFPVSASSKERDTFYRVNGDAVVILGDITAGFAKRLEAVLLNNPKVNTVALGSGGGAVYEAIAAGKFLRARGVTTRLYSNCYSACPLVYLGGSERIVMAAETHRFGFHQVHIDGVAIDFRSRVYLDIAQYMSEMGSDERALLSLMQRKSPQEMLEVLAHSKTSCQLRLATFVQRLCW